MVETVIQPPALVVVPVVGGGFSPGAAYLLRGTQLRGARPRDGTRSGP